jgi:hypothetical protein
MPFTDPDTGQLISTHSMLKVFRRCPKQTEFKYVMGLSPRLISKPLKRGSWVHRLLESHYRGDDWRATHRQLENQFLELFEEEREEYGNLPDDCRRIVESYLYHWREIDEKRKVVEVELVMEATWPDGGIYRCRIDRLVEDQFGLWIEDTKTTTRIPDTDFRLLDGQSALYLWAAAKNKLGVRGFVWDYVRAKPPTIPQLTKSGRLSERRIETDFYTFGKTLKKLGLPLADHREKLIALKHQPSPFFRRQVLEKSPAMLKRVAMENYHTHSRLQKYFDELRHPDQVERVVDKTCSWQCQYNDICAVQLFGGNIRPLIKQRYVEGEPLDYYETHAALEVIE